LLKVQAIDAFLDQGELVGFGFAWGIAVVTPQEALRQVRRNDEKK
jgi:hypothetical protein